MATSANNRELKVGHRVLVPAIVRKIISENASTGNIEAVDSSGTVIAADSHTVQLDPSSPDFNNTPPGLPNIIQDQIKTDQQTREDKAEAEKPKIIEKRETFTRVTDEEEKPVA